MAARFTITVNVGALIGGSVPRGARAIIRANAGSIMDTAENRIETGAGEYPVPSTGTLTPRLLQTNSPDTIPTGFSYFLDLYWPAPPSPGIGHGVRMESRTFGPFVVTADGDLLDQAASFDTEAVAPDWRSAFRAEMEDLRDEAEAARDQAAANTARLTAGPVTTGVPGTLASATITGDPGAQVLNLTIPAGAPGAPGGSDAATAEWIETGTATKAALSEAVAAQAGRMIVNGARDVPWPKGLVAFWDFQGATDGERLRNKAGVGEYVLEQSGPQPALPGTMHGPFGPALWFDDNQWLSIQPENLGALNIANHSDEVTVLAWFSRDKDHAGFLGGIWQENNNDPRRQYGLFLDLPFYGGDESVCMHASRTGTGSPDIPFSRDYSATARRVSQAGPTQPMRMLAGTYDGKQLVSYLDGTADSYPAGVFTDPAAPNGDGTSTRAKNPYLWDLGLNRTTTTGPFTVGAVLLTAGWDNFLHGHLGGLAVFNRALTPAELMQINLATTPRGGVVWRENFHNTLTGTTPEHAHPKKHGWRSYRGATATDTSEQAAVTGLNFVFTTAYNGTTFTFNRFLNRSSGGASNLTQDGVAIHETDFGMRLSQIHQMTFKLNNEKATDTVRLCIKVAGSWYATDATYSVTGDGRVQTDWTTAETKTVDIERTATRWRDLTITPGVALTLASAPRATDLPNGPLEGVGFYSHAIAGSVRIDSLELISTKA